MPSATSGPDADVVVSGLSGRLPESDSIEEFARQLFAGVDLVTEDDRRWTPGLHGLPKRSGKLKQLTRFDAAFFGVHAKQAHVMDPQLRLLLEVTHEAFVDAGLSPAELRGSRTGVYVGLGMSESYHAPTREHRNRGYGLIGCINFMLPNRISYTFDLKGPSISLDVGCAGSMNALVLAVNDIRAGRCDAAVVAGTTICLDPNSCLNFHQLTTLSADGRCATFDASASGYVRSEAVVGLLLQHRRDARRVYCTVRGARTNNDGYKVQGITHPSGAMQRRVAREAFEEAGLRLQDVAYLETHGTGTKVGDTEELNAIAQLFCKGRETPLLVGSVKSNMGHSEAVAGLCSIAKVVLAMERGVIPGNLHFKNANPDIPALHDGRIKVVDENTSWQGGLVSVNSFGLGGSNAHVIVEGGRGARPPPAEYPAPRLVLASGRTDEAVDRLLQLAAEHQRDAELHALIDAVHASAIPGYPSRGYAVLDPARGSAPVIEVLESEGEPRPIWFVFSGMGSQWAGMARELLRLPTFATSIARSATALEPYGVDLQYVISEAPSAALDKLINSFVSITAIQVALVDVLRELDLHPDGIIGHSLGEIGCAYADGTLTAEQTVLCAYWRGRCTLDAQPAPGAMAAVGLGWGDAARRCPHDIQIACHNSPDSVTIAGPLSSMEKFMEQLATEGVFVKRVETAGVAFHSRHIAHVAAPLRAHLHRLIPAPAPRSKRWLSSSVPRDQWDSDLARLSSAEYHVNNLVSPVRFADVLAQVPARALVVEVAPHGLLQAVLKRALPGAAHVPLLCRDAPDALVHLLAAVGKAYAASAQPQVSRLYPAVAWPVSRGTPALASHVGWDHSVEWSVAEFKQAGRIGENVIEYDLGKPEEAFIAGHNIDGKIIFPATGYLKLVWRTLAKMNMLEMDQIAVVLEDVHFRRATIVPQGASLRFLVTLFGGSGEFEICEGGEVVATGTARVSTDAAADRLSAAELEQDVDTRQDLPPLNSEDIYKELGLRGYNYQGLFRGIKFSSAGGTRGLLSWEGNWISFMDTALQYSLIGIDKRFLYLPTSLQRVVIDPAAQRKAVAEAGDAGVPVCLYPNLNIIVAGGVEFRGVKTSLAPRRAHAQVAPKLEKYVFVPLDGARVGTEDTGRSKRHALTAALQLALENCNARVLRVMERARGRAAEALLLPHAVKVLEAEPGVRVEATLVADADAPLYAAAMEPLGVKVTNKDGGLPANCHVVLGSDLLSNSGELCALAAASGATGFVLLEERARALDDPHAQARLTAASLTLVSCAPACAVEYVLLRRAASVPAARAVLEVRDDDYAWLERLKDAMKRSESEDMRVYVWSRAPGSGVQGLATCLRREPGSDRLRIYYLPGARDAFDPDVPAYSAQVQLDLAFNVLRADVWGTFRHLLLDDTTRAKVEMEHAYVNTLTWGDLSSLRWIESELRYAAVTAQGEKAVPCRVYYSALNFRDIMLATGKLPLNAIPKHLAEKECILGLEFSGRSSTGTRVMGLVSAKALATTVAADESFMWEVPKEWSLEEAATVPMAYATAYYALSVRGRMRRGEAVLVHAGAGGVGQAAIAIALHAGCAVFTTVGTPDKRAFLRSRFPQMPDANIGNSRDCSFEQLVLRRTGGRGVDLVLNSLAGDKLQASLRCLGEGGRFLEIGKLDFSTDTALGMAVFMKNVTVHGILLDVMFDVTEHHEKKETVRCVAEGIATGAVRPLPATVFAVNQAEQAFRYMATGKHIGKVLIRVREEEAGGEPAPARLLSAMPRTYMHPGKSYVLVGGLGGFGLELGEWLAGRGARALVLGSRGGVRTGHQAWCIARWRAMGVRVLVSTADAAAAAGARALLREAAALAPVGGVFNLAAVLKDALLENQDRDSFRAVAKPKIDVTRALDTASRELAPELEHFVVFSSVSCGRGNAGQSNYGFANSAMERLCEQRRADGLSALAVQWGAVADVGMLAASLGSKEQEVGGTMPQRIASCLDTLEALLATPHAVVSSVVLADNRARAHHEPVDLVRAVANILGIRDMAKVSETKALVQLGLDSLMIAEIKQTLERGYDVLLGVQEIRALTFGKLRALSGAPRTPIDVPAHGGGGERAEPPTCSELVPERELVRLPSQQPAAQLDKSIFMVPGIGGRVDLLRGVAALARGAVYGLQYARAAPLANMSALARFYVQRVRAAQPHPPYILLGYSFGASVAFEMALQLEHEGCAVRLVLVDASPASNNLNRLNLHVEHKPQRDEVVLLAFLGKIFYDLDWVKVASELKPLSDWEARVETLTRLIADKGARVEKHDVRDAAHALERRVLMASSYRLSTRLRAPVALFTARDEPGLAAALGGDYGLRAVCEGELSTRQLAGTHRTILAGDAARAIADHVSELAAAREVGTDVFH